MSFVSLLDFDMSFHDGRPKARHAMHFILALHRVEDGEGDAKKVSYAASPQVFFRPERIIVRARLKPGLVERFARALAWVRFPWAERRWVVEGEEEIEVELDEDDGDAAEDLEDLVAVGPVADEEEDDTDTDLEKMASDAPKRAWRLQWLRPFASWANRTCYREQHERLKRCFIRDLVVDGESLLRVREDAIEVEAHLVPVTAFVETSFPMRIDSPACKPNGKIEVLLEGMVPEMDVVLLGLGAWEADLPPLRVSGSSEPLVR